MPGDEQPADAEDSERDSERGSMTPGEVPESGPLPSYRWPFALVRRLYEWTLSWADTPYAVPALMGLAFIEASFFPIPPDVLLMAMSLGKPKRALVYAGMCTVGSVCGALLGWYIGMSLWSSLGVFAECTEYEGGAFLFEYVPGFTCHRFETVHGLYRDNAWMALFTAAFTPAAMVNTLNGIGVKAAVKSAIQALSR